MASEHHTEEHHRHFHLRDIPRYIRYIVTAIIFIALICFIQNFMSNRTEKQITTVDTSSCLEKTLRISELSTYQVTFNGVASVKDDDNDVLYYAAYNAKISIGLDMEKITVSVKNNNSPSKDHTDKSNDKAGKELIVSLPAVEITDIAVDPGSLDYIFEDNSANNEHISVTALPACKSDALTECSSNTQMFELAQENAINTIRALTQPFLDQNKEYSLKIVGEGGYEYE